MTASNPLRLDLASAVDVVPYSAARPEEFDEHLVSLLSPASFEAEQYRALRHVVEQRGKDAGLRVVGVTSAASGEGKTTTAINLAGALAQAPGARVLLVELDFREPTVASRLGLGHRSGRGLVNAILDGHLDLEKVVQRLPRVNMSALPAGACPAATYEMLKSPRLEALLEEARRQYDYIVLDTPPFVPVPDCRLISKFVDGFLLVVAAHRTPRRMLSEALDLIDPVKLIGLVFNGDDGPLARYYDAYTRPALHSARRWSRVVTSVQGFLGRLASPGA